MCGIVGFIGSGSRADLELMMDSLKLRGPDAFGTKIDSDSRVFLGFRRLSILDHEGGAQPMSNQENNLTIVFNGEIYNHIALRRELTLKGYVFRSDHSDTEVLLHGYQEWGSELPNHLNGMWAFVIYDQNKKQLFGSRDRFGEKPLYYTLQNGVFAFSSEVSSMKQHSRLSTTISRIALRKYFAYGYIPTPHSIYEKIFKLPAGHSFVFKLQEFSINLFEYWDLKLEPEFFHVPQAQLGDELIALLDQAVSLRLVADVPVGILLSGGVDSSAVTASAAHLLGRNSIQTFTIGFEEKSFDESSYAEQVASYLGTQHHLKRISMNQLEPILNSIAKNLDEPMADSSIIPFYLLSQFAREKVTVALGGDGGDELFAGYDPFKALNLSKLYSRLVPKPIHQGILALVSHLPVSHRNMSLDFKLKKTLQGLRYDSKFWFPAWMSPLSHEDLQSLMSEPMSMDETYSEVIQYWDRYPKMNLVDKTIYLFTKLYLADDILAKVDRSSMMHSLEVRTPLLDLDLVNFARKLPWQLKLQGSVTKSILKYALRNRLPSHILHRPKKGFGVPIGRWFQEGSLQFGPEKIAHALNSEFTLQKLSDHQGNRQDYRHYLWAEWLYSNWSQNQIKQS